STASVSRHNVPESIAGASLGYSVSSQYTGQVVGPLAGGFVGGHIGMRAVFIGTSVLMAIGAIANFVVLKGGSPSLATTDVFRSDALGTPQQRGRDARLY